MLMTSTSSTAWGAEIVRVVGGTSETELLPISLFDHDKSFQEVIHESPGMTGYTMLVPRKMYGKSNVERWKFSIVELGGKRRKMYIKLRTIWISFLNNTNIISFHAVTQISVVHASVTSVYYILNRVR
jgi:hypothetical protein